MVLRPKQEPHPVPSTALRREDLPSEAGALGAADEAAGLRLLDHDHDQRHRLRRRHAARRGARLPHHPRRDTDTEVRRREGTLEVGGVTAGGGASPTGARRGRQRARTSGPGIQLAAVGTGRDAVLHAYLLRPGPSLDVRSLLDIGLRCAVRESRRDTNSSRLDGAPPDDEGKKQAEGEMNPILSPGTDGRDDGHLVAALYH